MISSASMPRLKGFRFPREIIFYAVWAYHRFALSTADVEDLLSARGVIVSRETIRKWVNRFGGHFARCKHWLWRAVDANGDILDILVQAHRNAKAAKRFLRKLIERFGEPRVIITDKLRSYIKPISNLAPNADHRAHCQSQSKKGPCRGVKLVLTRAKAHVGRQANIFLFGFGPRLLLFVTAVFEPVTLAVHFKDVDVMGQSIQQSASEPL